MKLLLQVIKNCYATNVLMESFQQFKWKLDIKEHIIKAFTFCSTRLWSKGFNSYSVDTIIHSWNLNFLSGKKLCKNNPNPIIKIWLRHFLVNISGNPSLWIITEKNAHALFVFPYCMYSIIYYYPLTNWILWLNNISSQQIYVHVNRLIILQFIFIYIF